MAALTVCSGKFGYQGMKRVDTRHTDIAYDYEAANDRCPLCEALLENQQLKLRARLAEEELTA